MGQSGDTCVFAHRLFAAIDNLAFRRSGTDGSPVAAICMGETHAAIPLSSLQREFAITDDSVDGRMLSLVGRSLDFVTIVRLGDRLPAEVLGGSASWQPFPHCRQVALARLQRQLVAWLARNGGAIDAIGNDSDMRVHLDAALCAAAQAIGVAGPQQAAELVESLADELAYIEALRETLLRRVESTVGKLARLGSTRPRKLAHQETMGQVQRLSVIALNQVRDKFADVDAATGDALGALRDLDRRRAYIRSGRDWLHRSSRAWSPLLDEWARAGTNLDDFTLALLARTYRFLAPRFMPVSEWQNAYRKAQPRPGVMNW